MGTLNFFIPNNPILIKIISLPFCIIITILALNIVLSIFKQKTTKALFFNTLNGILMILIFFEYFYLNTKNNSINNSICLFTIMYLVLTEKIYIKENNEIEYSHKKIQILEINNKTLTTKYNELSAFQHDFNNIIQTFGSLLSIGKYDNLQKYYKSLKIDCQTLNDMDNFNTNKIKNPEILTILINKYELAKQNGIKINFEISSNLTKLNCDIFQIIRILGILLDNAIEANKDCTNKILNIELKQISNKQYIIIENSYNNKNVSLDSIFQKGFSTKPGNQGLGLWKVNRIINYNKNLKLYTSKTDNLFNQKLEINCNL